jgi:hypothetical protein
MNILWWEEEDTASGRPSRITLLAEIQSGFTRRLGSYKYSSLRVLLDGPYGNTKNMENYDSFLFVCTGIGITAQLLYIKELITKQSYGYRLKKVLLIWQVEERAHGEWINEYMDLLLDLDKGTDFVSNNLKNCTQTKIANGYRYFVGLYSNPLVIKKTRDLNSKVADVVVSSAEDLI